MESNREPVIEVETVAVALGVAGVAYLLAEYGGEASTLVGSTGAGVFVGTAIAAALLYAVYLWQWHVAAAQSYAAGTRPARSRIVATMAAQGLFALALLALVLILVALVLDGMVLRLRA